MLRASMARSKQRISRRKRTKRRIRVRSFIEHEFDSLDLGDERLEQRGRKLLGDLYCAPGESYLSASKNWAAAKGAYRFVDNDAVTVDKLLQPHVEKLIERCHEEEEILCIGDTTEMCLKKRPGTVGLGPLNYTGRRGFMMHPLWVVTPERLPLGIGDVRYITRSDEELGRKTGAYRDVPLEQRESAKWSWSLEATSKLRDGLGEKAPLVTAIFDREGDIFAVLSEAVANRERYRLIVRGEKQRFRADKKGSPPVWEDLLGQAVNGRITLEVPAGPKRKRRTAVLAVRWAKVLIKPPRVRAPKVPEMSPVEIYAIDAIEEKPPSKSDRIEWRLFTTIPVTSLEEAKGCIDRYACRWTIEWLFRTLKSQCDTEKRQFRSAEKLQKTIVQDMLVAFTIIYISMIRRVRPNQPCTLLFRESEWQALWTYSYEDPLPDRPPDIEEMIELLADIGGYIGRKSDPPPGPKVFRRALMQLPAIERMWLIAQR
jgi:Transposase DNA-binding/Transposase Tn5 dimerisation domain